METSTVNNSEASSVKSESLQMSASLQQQPHVLQTQPVSVSQQSQSSVVSVASSETQSTGIGLNADKIDNGNAKRGGWPKGKKRKKTPRDQSAPRQPLTGYVRFLNDHREKVRAENPNLPFQEITKLLALEWSQLPQNEKQQYLNAAEQDRERYLQEMNAYKQTEAYKIFTQQQAGKKPKEEPQEEMKEPDKEADISGFDIPIFTEEFLDHNKAREAELRQLRKSNTDYEQQNAIIQKHMEGMRSALEKLTVETQQQRNNNAALQQHLQQLRITLTASFSNTPLPGTNETPTLQTIDSYMSKLHTLLMDSSNHQLATTVRDIVVNRLDIQTS
ncbi:high mobility group protein 20A-like [Lycorma delicatula]|uniref:high mobility group protein 20A-like n=1 Tax=Lycorma delicatula TaxID=130591 RepID=UPI003F511AD4